MVIEDVPQIYVLLAEVSYTHYVVHLPIVFFFPPKNKKKLSKRQRLKLTWREDPADSQIGQLLYYLLGVQLCSIQLFLTHDSERRLKAPKPVLGLYMEEGVVSCNRCRFYPCTWAAWNLPPSAGAS